MQDPGMPGGGGGYPGGPGMQGGGDPQYGGGPGSPGGPGGYQGGPGGPGMQGQGGYPPQGGQGMQGQGGGGGYPQGGGGGGQGDPQGGAAPGGAVPRTKPCLTLPPPEGLNFSGIATGRWYVTKVYFDLVSNKPEVAPVCIYIDITSQGGIEDLNIALISQGVYKNMSGPINNKSYGEFTSTITLPGNPPIPLPMKTTIIDNDGDNGVFYSCGGQQGFYIHMGMIVSRQKSADPLFVSKSDPRFKSMEFKMDGTVITNQNCPS
ncbi:uncharacterized protein [Chironomus tepperi]|uniref:uncharacterized protein n=1 Tax=Chironomus tepperi TaxID=113505 RepID=UPI00391FC346